MDAERVVDGPPALSVVIPVFNEERILPELYERLRDAVRGMGLTFEIVCVDDGSTDGSGRILEHFLAIDPNVRLVQLSRNFGLYAAVTAGLDHSTGGLVALIDGDLQDAPEDLPRLIAKMREGYDVVYAIRTRRKESTIKRMVVAMFYRVLSLMTSSFLPMHGGLFSVMTREVVEAMKRMPERCRYLSGLRAWVGFRQCGIPLERAARRAGASRQTLRKLSRMAMDGMISFSYVPLRLATTAGIITAILSVVGGVWVVYLRLRSVNPPPGWASIVLGMLFIGSVQLLALGVIGEYVGRVYDEVKGRPLYVVRQRKGFIKRAEGAEGEAWRVEVACESR